MDNHLRKRLDLLAFTLGLLLSGIIPATAHALDRELAWDANSEGDLAGYILYYGMDSRGCVLAPDDEAFVYSGPQARQGASPIVIFLSDLEDPANPSYTLYGLDDGVDYSFAVTAFDLAGKVSMYGNEAQSPDVLGPVLCDASAPTNTQVVLTFNEFIDETSSTNTANYSLLDESSNPVAINSITYDFDTFKKVTLNTGPLVEGATYTLTVNNVQDFFDGNPVIPNTRKVFTFTNAPHIRRAGTPLLLSRVDVEFSEDVDPSTASTASNYVIDNGINVNSAIMAVNQNQSDNSRTVLLSTSSHTEGAGYTLTVNNVEDTAGNVIATDSTFIYTTPQDLAPPVALSGHMTNSALNRSEVHVVFNEHMDQATANDVNNYSISGGITINSASLYGDGKTVVLDTSLHDFGNYQLTVMNVQDNSLAGNSVLSTGLDYLVIDAGDPDADDVINSFDNCTSVANADQRDTDVDGYGNLCDGDLNDDGSTDTLDLNLYKQAHRTSMGDANYDVDADFNGDGVINTLDLNIYKGLHRTPPGPSCCGAF